MELAFTESKEFYRQLDSGVRAGDTSIVVIEPGSLTEKSKLWPRLRRCRNWSTIKAQLEKARQEEGVLRDALTPKAYEAITTGLLAFITALLGAALLYAIYKQYEVELDLDPQTMKLRMRFKPTR